MKKILIFCLFLVSVTGIQTVKAQADELAQLALDIEKLSQLKKILTELYTGYEVLTKGYNTIRDLAEGNFNIHKVFLDGLLSVSPTVQKYKRIADIISDQQSIVKEYKSALSRFQGLNVFGSSELSYLGSVYQNLLNSSLKNLDELLMVITSNQLRMNDAERLTAIDRIYLDVQDKLDFLRQFNNNTSLLAGQRQKELEENNSLKRLYGIQY
jgi:DNA repair ATPase RecN